MHRLLFTENSYGEPFVNCDVVASFAPGVRSRLSTRLTLLISISARGSEIDLNFSGTGTLILGSIRLGRLRGEVGDSGLTERDAAIVAGHLAVGQNLEPAFP